MINGESRPLTRDEGDRVVAGTVATDNSIRVRVTAVGEETALAGIQRLVGEAQRSIPARKHWPTEQLLAQLLRRLKLDPGYLAVR